MMCFEFLHVYLLQRWTDVMSKLLHDLKCKSCRMIIENKLVLVLNCRTFWPMLVSFAEDVKFSKDTYNLHFLPDLLQLIVLHDSSSVTLKELTNAA